MSEQWLKSNTKNRKAAQPTINAYAEDMAAGRWELTNQGIAFYESGELADGQHALQWQSLGQTRPFQCGHLWLKSIGNQWY